MKLIVICDCKARHAISLISGVHGWQKERLVSAICSCVKLTSFIAPLHNDATILNVFN